MGLVLIYSGTRYMDALHSFPQKQAMFLCMGVAAYVWVSFIDIEYLMEKWWWVFLLLGLSWASPPRETTTCSPRPPRPSPQR